MKHWYGMLIPGLILLFTINSFAGSGGTHFTTGALVGKYLAPKLGPGFGSKFQSYGSALLLGVTSHLVMDHFYQYEPSFDQADSDTRYFQAEGRFL
ncbi:MAG: hypothetical protein Kow0037_06720 [Calditrichia bacterium]